MARLVDTNLFGAENRMKAIQEADFELVVALSDEPVAELLPIILDKLHCNVVGLNAYADTVRASPHQSQFQAALKQLQIIATALGVQLGARLSPGGEKLFLVDDRGYLLQNITACAALVDMALRDAPGSAVAIPINLPNLFEEIAKRHHSKIIRTELELEALIRATCPQNVIMAGDGAVAGSCGGIPRPIGDGDARQWCAIGVDHLPGHSYRRW